MGYNINNRDLTINYRNLFEFLDIVIVEYIMGGFSLW